MKKIALIFAFTVSCVGLYAQNFYPYQAISFNKVHLNDNFWLPKIEINRTETIPWAFYQSKITGRIKNFEQAAAGEGQLCGIYPFDDSDVYKIIEGASYSLQVKYDPVLDKYVDSLISVIAAAQEPDGYLFTARTMGDKHEWIGTERYQNEHLLSHELYNMGHFYEAACAHYLATGKKNMLNIGIKNANHLLTVFGPGKKSVAPGHQVIEIGLVKMYLATGEKKYLDLSQFFIECRGQRKYDKKPGDKDASVWDTGEYWQDHVPAIQQTEAIGHAVRATYLYSGMADVAALTQNQAYINAIHKIWDNAAGKKTYITGGIGSAGGWEGFGPAYQLPNESAYCETCAGIGNVFWNHRMFMLTGEAKYMDMVERTLYNGILGGIGLDGKTFYYANPMEYTLKDGKLSGENKRSPWFKCSCCPSNICRFMPSIPGYIYAKKDKDLYVNLYIGSETSFEIDTKNKISLKQTSNMPWEGTVNVEIGTYNKKGSSFALKLRVPGWANGNIFPTDLYGLHEIQEMGNIIKINGESTDLAKYKDGYFTIDRIWKNGDKVEIDFPMETQQVYSNPNITSNQNLIAVQNGPIMYCAEFVDNEGKTSNILLNQRNIFSKKFEPNLLNGVLTLSTNGKVVNFNENDISTLNMTIKLIPYYARSNRGSGEMKLWFPTKITGIEMKH
ncbi:glycoside hydrolase family 127 protein [Lacihabitans sp. LS3-19]|uniref:glycoside hydrolase family 127 protein n=1 Tax=Lacihabitans sp. LS3-19 TaxID=2487335 RepID=UPI0020CD401D|nr:beta-L-arabinofuranosidase domain-containing protein [Lacihabitans sp. LS3-19]MCP9769758.1 glycoside hydrolase family 127 protein [Lacihabitans sp. LS3-19]